MDAVEQLARDHVRLRALARDLCAGEGPDDAKGAYRQIAALLADHEAAEEDVVYPTLYVRTPGIAEELRRMLAAHEEVDGLLDEMRELAPGGPGFAIGAEAVAQELAAHLDLEDEVLFPLLRRVLSDADRARLSRDIQASKERTRRLVST